MSFGKIVLSYGDYVIRDSELQILKNKEWVNDVLIGFNFEHLGKCEEAEGIKFLGPEVTQLIKMISKDEEIPLVLGDLVNDLKQAEYIFIPVNDSVDPDVHSGGSHWSLLIFSRVDNAFVHFDSTLSQNNQKDAETVSKKLGPVVSSMGKTTSFANNTDCVAQANGYDCGLHVIGNAQLISKYVNSDSDVSLLTPGCPTVIPKDCNLIRLVLTGLIHGLAKESSDSS